MEHSTASLITSLRLGRSKYLIYALEWVITQGMVVLLNFQWLGFSRAEYLAVWDTFVRVRLIVSRHVEVLTVIQGWIIPALITWLIGLALITRALPGKAVTHGDSRHFKKGAKQEL